ATMKDVHHLSLTPREGWCVRRLGIALGGTTGSHGYLASARWCWKFIHGEFSTPSDHCQGSDPRGDIGLECQQLNRPLHVFWWSQNARNAGLVPDAAYLVRPDGYIALPDSGAKSNALRRYFAEHYVNGNRLGDSAKT
ncbi:MAG: hypothetical protein ABI338_05225, partial [Gemmatimonadaceae bacterium]